MTKQEREQQNNARRLAHTLYCSYDDMTVIKRIASVLHYEPEQLIQDIIDLEVSTYIASRKEEETE